MCFPTEIKAVGSGFAEKVLGVFSAPETERSGAVTPLLPT
jgi:hypothetical protein